MKYWILHILLLSIIISVWLYGYSGYSSNNVEVPKTIIEMIDTIFYETPIEREIVDTLYLSLPSMMMLSIDTMDTVQNFRVIDTEFDKVVVNRTIIDTIFDTMYVRIPVYKELELKEQSTPILVSLEVVVTIIGGLFNILIGFFQLNERKKNNK